MRPIAGTRPRGTEERETARSSASCSPTRRRAPSTSCWSTSAATTSAGSPPSARWASPSGSSSSATRTSCTSSRTCAAGWRRTATAFDAFRATFPAGTLSGAPKIRAMEIIDELEPVRRGVYGGAVGYFGFSGNMDTCIAIRTVAHQERTRLRAGRRRHRRRLRSRNASIAECVNKARALLQALRARRGVGER